MIVYLYFWSVPHGEQKVEITFFSEENWFLVIMIEFGFRFYHFSKRTLQLNSIIDVFQIEESNYQFNFGFLKIISLNEYWKITPTDNQFLQCT